MITAGVDLGIETVKAVILKDGKVLARSIASSGGADRAGAADLVWNEALKLAGLSAADVSKVVATGQGKWDVRFANDSVVEPVADVRAAHWLFPSARTVIDIGADQARAARFDASGKTLEHVLNLKCAAGMGTLLKSIARMLGITIDEMSQPSNGRQSSISVNDRCAVFAEMDAHWLINNDTPREDVIQAINEAVATRINSMLNEKINFEKDVVLIGGVAMNRAVVSALEKQSGLDFLMPEHPEFACALGAALIAAE
ncbi:MAG: CoA activase [Chloroflexi bacterium]|nr:CoA activase [Chloroflexota bacterium]